MKVSIIGTGYVGLVSGVCLAEKGHQVTCVDVDPKKVDQINSGIPPIYEIGLEELLKKNIHTNLVATTHLTDAVINSEISLIAVGTPFDGQEIDLKYIKQVANEIGEVLKHKSAYHVVIVKSTVVPGTTDDIVLPILEQASGKKAGVDFGVGMNPEFLKEGEAIADFMEPDRIVLGGIDTPSLDALEELYAAFEGVDKIRTTPKTAEMIKYTANSLLATLISFSNEIGNLCATIGVDVVDALHGVHLDKRFTPILETGDRIIPSFTTYLAAGCGFGGSCFPKDVKALIAFGEKANSPMQLLQSVIDINEVQYQKVYQMLKEHLPTLLGTKVTVLGMAFKPGTDDIRESPSLPLTKLLLEKGAIVKAFDPIARHEAEKVFGTAVEFCDHLQEAIDDAAAIVLMTRWPEFREIPQLIQDLEVQPLVVDGRRMLNKTSVLNYIGIGL